MASAAWQWRCPHLPSWDAQRVSPPGRRAVLHRCAFLWQRQPLHQPPLRAQPGARARLHVPPGPALPQDRLLQHPPDRGRGAAGVGARQAHALPAPDWTARVGLGGPRPPPSSALPAGLTTGSASGTSKASCSAAGVAPPSAGTPAPPWPSGRPTPRPPRRTGCPTPAPPPPTRYESRGPGAQADAVHAAVRGEKEKRTRRRLRSRPGAGGAGLRGGRSGTLHWCRP